MIFLQEHGTENSAKEHHAVEIAKKWQLIDRNRVGVFRNLNVAPLGGEGGGAYGKRRRGLESGSNGGGQHRWTLLTGRPSADFHSITLDFRVQNSI